MTEKPIKRPPFIILRTKNTLLWRSVISGRYLIYLRLPDRLKFIGKGDTLNEVMRKFQERSPEHFPEFLDAFQRRLSGDNRVQHIIAATQFPLELPQ